MSCTRVAALCAAFALSGCHTTWQAKFAGPAQASALEAGAPFLKAHLRDGRVYVLERWRVDERKGEVTGQGLAYSTLRRLEGRGAYAVKLADVVLFETNRPHEATQGGVVALAVMTTLSLAGTALCAANPKACFGSCPTFYTFDGERESLMAEGFSSSVAKVFEATDVDALYEARPRGRRFEVRMTNEAYETHAVRSVRVLAAPRRGSERVLRDGDAFVPARTLHAALRCRSERGDCTQAVRAFDRDEYFSPSDTRDLAERETLELELPAGAGARGLVIGARNTLLNTFLFYQALAYMGREVGTWMRLIESGDAKARASATGMGQVLGDLEVHAFTRRGWVRAGAFSEVGPIAREVQLVRLPADLPEGPVRVRLVMARGNWRVDWAALAELGEAVAPIALDVTEVHRRGAPDEGARARLLSKSRYLVTQPGDAYTLVFQLPGEPGEHELFLEARGYYYEWMRREWLGEESPQKLLQLFSRPDLALRRLAPKFKKLEPSMERIFWDSRIGSGQ